MHYLTDVSRLDGLNKNMRDWDIAHYGRIFNAACRNSDMPMIEYPHGENLANILTIEDID